MWLKWHMFLLGYVVFKWIWIGRNFDWDADTAQCIVELIKSKAENSHLHATILFASLCGRFHTRCTSTLSKQKTSSALTMEHTAESTRFGWTNRYVRELLTRYNTHRKVRCTCQHLLTSRIMTNSVELKLCQCHRESKQLQIRRQARQQQSAT